ncbi:uncharacterized protein LOC124404795 [Diprion similis]|uniref:uncharacterized protein LOC124404795 n=1 Tax=Diprion similis TaxID=362088 RepID=UPI001EF81FA3|nr:uncharacterized protein LOC124404795 [Diprion similis]XP_046735158.1 uncharacterized protein LOC124404795 [Diprion similis]
MENSCLKQETYPLLSPVMESELLLEPWPLLKNSKGSTPMVSTPSFWREEFQDLRDWCVDPQSISRSNISRSPQGQRDYPTGEDITTKISGVKDNYYNLSNIKSEFGESTGIGDSWTVENNIESIGMSFERSQPLGQDQFNTTMDISNVWMDLTPATNTDEQQAATSTKFIPNINKSIPDSSFQMIGENFDNWFPITTNVNDFSRNDLVNINQSNYDPTTLDSYQSTSANSTVQEQETQLLADGLLTTDLEFESFDLLSYVCEESGQSLMNKSKTTTLEIVEPSQVVNTNKRKSSKENKSVQVKAKTEPVVPPLKISLKATKPPIKKRRISKDVDQESGNYTDSDSDSQTSDYSYRELREKNNKASRKSRINKKVKEAEMMKKANDLEKANAILKMKAKELERLVIAMRKTLLQLALKKES